MLCYFAADVEGSHGKPVRPGISNLISLGLVQVGSPDEHFYVELKPVTPFWDPATEAIHKMTPAYLAAHGTDARAGLEKCRAWVLRVAAARFPVFCAMPLTYDWELADDAFRRTGVPNPFVQALDGRDLYRRINGMERHEDVYREAFARAYPTDIPHLHHALGDALEYEEQVRVMLRQAGRLP